MNFFILNQFFIVLVNFLAILIGFLAYRNNPKEKINKIFTLMIVLSIFWINFAYIPRVLGKDNINLSLFFLKIAWFVTPLFFVSLYFLIIHIVKKEKEYKVLNNLILFFGLLSAFSVGISDLVIKNIEFIGSYLTISYGFLMIPFLIVIFFLIFITFYLLLKEYLKSLPSLKVKLQYFLVGILIFYIANIIFNIILPVIYNIFHFYWIGDYSIIFFLGFIAYAIVKKELFGIKVILTQVLIGIFVIFLSIQLFLSETFLSLIWSSLLIAVFVYFGYHIIKDIYREIEDKKKIEELGKKLLTREKALSKTFTEIAEERAKRLYKTTYDSLSKDREIMELKMKIMELEDEK